MKEEFANTLSRLLEKYSRDLLITES